MVPKTFFMTSFFRQITQNVSQEQQKPPRCLECDRRKLRHFVGGKDDFNKSKHHPSSLPQVNSQKTENVSFKKERKCGNFSVVAVKHSSRKTLRIQKTIIMQLYRRDPPCV